MTVEEDICVKWMYLIETPFIVYQQLLQYNLIEMKTRQNR